MLLEPGSAPEILYGYDTLRVSWQAEDSVNPLLWDENRRNENSGRSYRWLRQDVFLSWGETDWGDVYSSEVSLPKLLHGTNADALRVEELPAALAAWQLRLDDLMGRPPDVTRCDLRRVDACADRDLAGGESSVRAVIHRLMGSQFRGKYPIRYSETSLRWTGKSRQLRVYGKQAESGGDDPFLEGRLRAEVQTMGQKALKYALEHGDLSPGEYVNLPTGPLTPTQLLEQPFMPRLLLGKYDQPVQRAIAEQQGEPTDVAPFGGRRWAPGCRSTGRRR